MCLYTGVSCRTSAIVGNAMLRVGGEYRIQALRPRSRALPLQPEFANCWHFWTKLYCQFQCTLSLDFLLAMIVMDLAQIVRRLRRTKLTSGILTRLRVRTAQVQVRIRSRIMVGTPPAVSRPSSVGMGGKLSQLTVRTKLNELSVPASNPQYRLPGIAAHGSLDYLAGAKTRTGFSIDMGARSNCQL